MTLQEQKIDEEILRLSVLEAIETFGRKEFALMLAQAAQEPVECLDCGSHNVGTPATYDSLVNSVKAQAGMLHIDRLDKWLDANLKERKQRPWVGLTDEDRKAALLKSFIEWECEELLFCAREDYLLIEQALKEKNNG